MEQIEKTVYVHESGMEYEVVDFGIDATGYEETGEVGKEVVWYRQIDAGHYPSGQMWSREVESFKKHFTKK